MYSSNATRSRSKSRSSTARSNQLYDVILLFGPPIQNKSSYLPSSYFMEDFTVISPEYVFRENSSLGLRDVALNMVASLKEKKQVFIEDEFRLKSTRSSIVNLLKKKVPQCSILLLKVIPKYGLRQVCWCHQFSHVHKKKLTSSYDWSQVKQWFDESQSTLLTDSDYVDQPDSRNEEFDIQEISIPLQTFSHLKFETPCLFIQWEAVLSPSGDFLPGMQDVFYKWKSSNSNGRIIFIYDGKNIAKGFVSESDEKASIKRYLNDLAVMLQYPVYVLSVKSRARTSSFCLPPQPGILAFLQRQHLIDLHSKQTVYIYNTVEHMNMTQSVGMINIKGDKVQKHPDCIFKRIAASPQIPAMLKNIEYLEDGNSRESFTLPLYERCGELAHGCVSQLYDNGLHLSIFVPSKELFMSAQESFALNISKSKRQAEDPLYVPSPEETQNQTMTSRAAEVDQDLPVWMGKKLRRESTLDSVSSMENQSGSDTSTGLRCNKTIYVMTEKELCELAFQVLVQAGKETKKDPCEPSTSADTG